MTSPWSRRAFLRGTGVALALPLLPSLLPKQAWADGDKPPVRLVFWYVPNGIHMPAWRPAASGAGYDLPLILEPLAPVQHQVSVLSGLTRLAGQFNIPGDHARGTGCFLTCERPHFTSDANILNGISVDQVAAQAIGDQTPFSSLQLGLEAGGSTGNCDSGYSCAYVRNISWSDERTPLPKQHDPRVVFDRLFADYDQPDPVAAERRRALRLSVLDAVADDAQDLQRKAGASDRIKLDQYLTGVREVERRIDAMGAGAVCEVPGRPGTSLSVPQRAEVMNELMAVALQCDMTRIISYMFANGGSNRNHSWISGASGGHHEISHHQNVAAEQQKIAAINRWEVELFSSFLQRLEGMVEADGSRVLDNTLVLFGSEISDGNRHNHDNLPVLLAGGGGGAVTPGRHVVYDREPVADLYLAMLQAVGVTRSTFGMDGTRPLAGLT
jgi:hypothetical protein